MLRDEQMKPRLFLTITIQRPPHFHRKGDTDRPGGISIPEENSTFEGLSSYCYLRSMIK